MLQFLSLADSLPFRRELRRAAESGRDAFAEDAHIVRNRRIDCGRFKVRWRSRETVNHNSQTGEVALAQ